MEVNSETNEMMIGEYTIIRYLRYSMQIKKVQIES